MYQSAKSVSAKSASWWFCARALARGRMFTTKYTYISNNGFSTNVGKNQIDCRDKDKNTTGAKFLSLAPVVFLTTGSFKKS